MKKQEINEKKLYKKAVDYFGVSSQVKQAIEECAELIVALSHIRRRKETVFGVCGEIADVEIMCGQLREMVTPEIVDKIKNKKLQRLALFIGEE